MSPPPRSCINHPPLSPPHRAIELLGEPRPQQSRVMWKYWPDLYFVQPNNLIQGSNVSCLSVSSQLRKKIWRFIIICRNIWLAALSPGALISSWRINDDIGQLSPCYFRFRSWSQFLQRIKPRIIEDQVRYDQIQISTWLNPTFRLPTNSPCLLRFYQILL